MPYFNLESLKKEFLILKKEQKVLNTSKKFLKQYLLNALKNNKYNNNHEYKEYESLNENNLEFSYIDEGKYGFVLKVKVNKCKKNGEKFKELAMKLGEQFSEENCAFRKIKNQKLENVSQRLGDSIACSPSGKKILVEVSEYAEKGNLKKVIEHNIIPANLKHSYMAQMIKGISNLASKKIYHRDIKLENFLLTETGEVQVTDLGFSVLGNPISKSTMGTPLYMSPELMRNYMDNIVGEIDYSKSDIWSLGMLILEIYGYDNPFKYVDDEIDTNRLISTLNSDIDIKYIQIPLDIRKLLKEMLVVNPNKRISFETLNKEYKDLFNKYDLYNKKSDNNCQIPSLRNNNSHNKNLDKPTPINTSNCLKPSFVFPKIGNNIDMNQNNHNLPHSNRNISTAVNKDNYAIPSIVLPKIGNNINMNQNNNNLPHSNRNISTAVNKDNYAIPSIVLPKIGNNIDMNQNNHNLPYNNRNNPTTVNKDNHIILPALFPKIRNNIDMNQNNNNLPYNNRNNYNYLDKNTNINKKKYNQLKIVNINI